MRTDPRLACANADERMGWALLHDLVAHPLMALTMWSRPALRFHDWTSRRAWPRSTPELRAAVHVQSIHWGALLVERVGGDCYRTCHPNIDHALVVTARDAVHAAEQAEQWFDSLAAEFGGKFNPPGRSVA
ncbi:MAG: hypothetical protein DI587_31270 [Variovorax paradoxus]|nr:MAG: hypothetical protein DI583_31270 [Variovorax paradoxus]PZQ03142.1 MAG: hypothetical protein DI587_31270 [Variovorax paradoxus]